MNELENEYNKRFKNQEMPDDDFDVEGLWDAVTDELDQEPPVHPGSPLWKLLGLGFLVLFFVGTGLTLYYSQVKEDVVVGKNIADQKTSEVERKVDGSRTPEVENTALKNAGVVSLDGKEGENKMAEIKEEEQGPFASNGENSKLTSSQKQAVSKIKQTLDSSISNKNKKIKKAVSKSTLRNTPLAEESSFSNIDNEIVNVTDTGKNNDLATTKKSNVNGFEKRTSIGGQEESLVNSSSSKTGVETNSVSETDVLNEERTETELIEKVDSKVMSALLLTVKEFQFSETWNEKGKGFIEPVSQKKINWELGLYTGVNALFLNFKSTANPDVATSKNDVEKISWGSSYGINAGLVWNQKWILKAGAEYNKLWTEFNYEMDSIDVVPYDSLLLKVFVDGSGTTLSRSYALDTIVDEKRIRTISHHNQYKVYSFPIEIGFQKRTKRLVYGLSAGAVLNFAKSQKGRTIGLEDELIDFTEVDEIAPLKSFQLGLRVSPFIGCRLTSRMTLRLEPKWSWSKGSVFGGRDFKVGVQQVNLNVGVGVRF